MITVKHRLLFVIFVVALALRAMFWMDVIGSRAPLRGDEIDYHRLAMSLAEGSGFVGADGEATAARPPLYPAVLSLIYRLFGAHAAAGRILQILLGGAIVLLTYLLARMLASEAAAFGAAAIATMNPSLVFVSAYLLAENLYTVILLLFLVLFSGSRWKKPPYLVCALGGVLLGLGSLARPNGFVFALFAVAAVLCLGAGGWRGRIARAAILFIGALIALAPWAVRNEARLGRAVLLTTHGGATFYQGNNIVVWDNKTYHGTVAPLEALPGWKDIESKGELEADREAWRLGKEFVRAHPLFAAKMAMWRFERFWRLRGDAGFSGVKSGWWWDRGKSLGSIASSFDFVFVFSIIIMPLFIIGLIATIRRARELVFLYGIILAHTAASLVFFGSLRSRMPIEPVVAILAAFGAAHIVRAVRARFRSEAHQTHFAD
ncbi:MAG: glycosyltransferase family 39 protein [Candidatus Krumholzibacteria bacterium]|nr:glycosyltransferase family 39 protein [Candidatus Krumholzibacteria bacterium]